VKTDRKLLIRFRKISKHLSHEKCLFETR